MDRACLDARAEGMARAPIVEMVIPSTLDDTLAPKGAHVASLFCQHFAPEADWDMRKAGGRSTGSSTLSIRMRRASGRASSRTRRFRPPTWSANSASRAATYSTAQLSLDQLWSARPVLGHADYRTPVKGLYLCGSGAHPGGGVTGAPGHNCAREVLRDFGRRMSS